MSRGYEAADRAAGRRRRELAAIHVLATKRLGLDRETYVALLQRVAGVSSSADLDEHGRARVLDELRRLGASHNEYPGKPHNFDSLAMPELIAKVEAQLAAMHLPWSYADAIARQQHGVDRVTWVRDPAKLRAIIAALHVEQEKRELDKAVNEQLQRLGLEPARIVEMLKPLRPNWRRHRPSLRLVLEYLTKQEA